MLVDLGKGRFIIDTVEDPFARAAIEAYADACDPITPTLARGLRGRLGLSLGSFICLETALRIVSRAQEIDRKHEGYSKPSWDRVQTVLESLAPDRC